MRILVTFAVEAEFAPWRRRHAFVSVSMPTPVGLQPHFFYRGTVFENDVDVLLTGIGWDESKRGNWPRYALRELLKNKPDLLISSGLAGGLRADLRCSEFGDFVDMEGYHILQIMSGTRIPSISVRAISDTRDVELPCEIGNVVNRDGRVQTIPLLKLIIKQPGRIRSLLNFGTQSRNAAISIADFLDRFLEAAGGSGSEAQAKRETVAAR